jgi:hypothetical protein
MAAASITSEATVLQSISNVSYEVSWVGTMPVGALKLQVSNTYSLGADGTPANSGIWTDVPMDVDGAYATSIPITGNSGNGFIDVTLQAGYSTRLVYTKTSGTGTLTATIAGKVA